MGGQRRSVRNSLRTSPHAAPRLASHAAHAALARRASRRARRLTTSERAVAQQTAVYILPLFHPAPASCHDSMVRPAVLLIALALVLAAGPAAANKKRR